MKKYQIVLLFVLILTNSCKEDPLPTKGHIAGRITEEGTNNPIPAATIYITGAEQSYTTGEDGTYKISDLYADDYSVNVSKLGYITDSKILTVEPEKTTPGDFILKMDLPVATPTSVILTYDKQSETIELENTRSGDMPFTTETSKTWLKVSPESGSIQSLNKKIITITADLTNVPYANYDETVLINVGSASLSIPVQITYQQPPYINIEKPASDETYKMGEIMPILWNSNLTGKVRIDLIRYSSIYLQIRKEVTNDNGGNYSWQIPALDAANYQIKITSVENENITAISGAFNLIVGPTAPSVITKNASELNPTSIKIGGEITHIGLQATVVNQYGHVYSRVNPNPTIADNKTNLGTTTQPIVFESNITCLLEAQTYYIAAYATNTKGTAYGEVLTITTTSFTPTVETSEILSITQNSAIAGGEVVSDGGSTITERGICWNTSSPATIDDNNIKDTETEIGVYSLNLSNLAIGTTYYIRAYAKNSSGIGYGAEKTFRTLGTLPSVITDQISQLTSQAVTANGQVTSNGGDDITAYGFCYSSSSQMPTINDTKINVGTTNISEFNKTIGNLNPNTTYYLRAFATNANGTGYGDAISFTTLSGTPIVTTNDVTASNSTTIVASATLQSIGDQPLTEYGFCYSITSNPTINSNKLVLGTDIFGDFTGTITGLIPNTKYYVRAYATNELGTSYGLEKSATTPEGQYLNITSPYEGEIWDAGQAHEIKWATNYSDRRIIIEHWQGDNYTELTNNTDLSAGVFSWNVPENITNGTNHFLKIIDYNTLTVLATSAVFTIPGKLELTYPTEGSLIFTNNIKVSWTANYSTTLKLELYNGTQFISNIAAGINASSGEYIWDASAQGLTLQSNYRIKLTDETNTQTFIFSGIFELVNETNAMIDTRDSQVYKIVTIGTQVWLAQDLNYKTSNSESNNAGMAYPKSEMVLAIPEGWHLPTDAEWQTLEQYLGMTTEEASATGWRYSGSVGQKLKSESGWYNNGNGTNLSGFNAKPSTLSGSSISWWTSTVYHYPEAYYHRSLQSGESGIRREDTTFTNTRNIRCIKD